MKKTRIRIAQLLILFTLFLGCKNKQTEEIKPQTVFLSVSENDTLLNWVALSTNMDVSSSVASTTSFRTKEEVSDLAFLFPMDEPQLLRIYGVDIFTFPTYIYVTPGDTLKFQANENSELIFEGKNAAHYNFYTKLSERKYLYPKYEEAETAKKYKTECEQIYKQKTSFLEEYSAKETVTDAFIKKIKDDLKFEYLFKLMESKDIITLEKHLSPLSIRDFDREDLLDSWFFKIALMKYISLKAGSDYTSFSKDKLRAEVDYVKTHLSDKVRQYVITKTILVYNQNLSPQLIEPLKICLQTYLPEIEKELYKKELELVYNGLERLNAPLSETLLNSKLTDLQGNDVTLKDVLEQQNDAVKVIDFWASWCAPCIESIQKSYDFRTQLSNEHKVSWLYFSVDKDIESWKKKVTELKSYGMDKNQYLIDESAKKDISDYFNISGIPHYTLLDDKNNLVMIKIPSPSDSLAFSKTIKEVRVLR